jgi:hypothetical protein
VSIETLIAAAPDGGDVLAARLREVLEPVFAPRPRWPSLEEWREILPAWFVDACSDDVHVTNCVIDRWSLRAWIYWFQPEQRRWTPRALRPDGQRLAIEIEPTGQGSLLLGALE